MRHDVLREHHKIIKQRNVNWSAMKETFNTTSITEFELKLLDLNHTADIVVNVTKQIIY